MDIFEFTEVFEDGECSGQDGQWCKGSSEVSDDDVEDSCTGCNGQCEDK